MRLKSPIHASLLLAFAIAPAQAAPIPLTNADFETGDDPGKVINTVSGWNEENAGNVYINDTGTRWYPIATQFGYFANSSGAAVNQDLDHGWTAADRFTLSFDAAEAGWRTTAAGDAIQLQLRQANGSVLWDSGSINLDGTLTGSENAISFTGTGHQFSFNIDASTFATGTPGSQINLRIARAGGVVFFDNVQLEVNEWNPLSNVANPSQILVFLQGGQSNSDGFGDPADLLPAYYAPRNDIEFYHGNSAGGSPLAANTWIPLQPGSGSSTLNPGDFGPEISFGKEIQDALGTDDVRIAIIKHTHIATNLYFDWAPGGDATTTGDGPSYVGFQTTVNNGLNTLSSKYPKANIKVVGMIWDQGEGDLIAGQAANYQTNLTNFIADVRATYGSDLKFVLRRIAPQQWTDAARPADFSVLTTAQDNVAAADPMVHSFSSDDSPVMPTNIIHFNAAGQILNGERYAKHMLQLFDKGPIMVYLMGGQSNTQGVGRNSKLTAGQLSIPEIQFYHSDDVFSSGTPNTWMTLRPAGFNNLHFGPEIGMGEYLRDNLPAGTPIAFIKHAEGGTSLEVDWAPGSDVSDTANWGPQFSKFVTTVDKGIAALAAQGWKPEIHGMIWQQGEEDAKDGLGTTNTSTTSADDYGNNLSHFIDRVREQFATDIAPVGLRFVLGQVLPYAPAGGSVQSTYTGRSLVRQAELDLDESSGAALAKTNTATVPTNSTDHLTHAQEIDGYRDTDEVHLIASAQLALGHSMGTELLALTTPPTIESLTLNDYYVGSGDSVTLSWQTTGATTITIDQGVGDVTSISAIGDGSSSTTAPAATTTYTLTATNAAGSSQRTVRLAVGPARPNILLFLVDDMGTQDTSEPFVVDGSGNDLPTYQNGLFRTPNMQSLASKGMKFTNAYAMPVCSPSRCCLMNGQNSVRHHVTNWTGPTYNQETGQNDITSHNSPLDWRRAGLDASAPTLPSILGGAGYRSIFVGKAHFGNAPQNSDPRDCGFDIHIGGSPIGHPGSYLGTANYGSGIYQVPDLDAYHGTNTFLTEGLTLEMNKAIEDSVHDGVPFFAYMAHYAVHSPFTTDSRFSDHYPSLSGNALAFATMVEGMDKSLGDIMTRLNQLGVAEDTLVIFLSDNGSDSPLGAGSSPLRGKKGQKYEGGTRVPMIVGWAKPNPANSFQTTFGIPANSHEDDIVAIFDLFPTILRIANVTHSNAIDGFDLSEYFKDSAGTHRPQELLIHFPHDHNSDYYSWFREGSYKLIYNYINDSFELYDLSTDIGETTNLAASEPDRVMAMARKMAGQMKDHGVQWPRNDSDTNNLDDAADTDDPLAMPVLPGIDLDNDGIDDNSEDANRNGLVDPGETDPDNDNTDSDNITDGDEAKIGTDPLDPNSRFSLTPATLPDGTLEITWPSALGASFTIRSSTDLNHWSTIVATGVPASAGATTTYTLSPPVAPRTFYRAELE